MKIIAYCALHYGTDYLEWSIRSVIDHVDEFWCLYTPIGSHGHRTDRACPDSRDDLYAAAWRGAGDKLRWIEGTWDYEGQQREAIHQYAPDADMILVVDADEIWPDGLAEKAISRAFQYEVDQWRVPMVHFWRSFYRAIIHDPAYPVRVIRPKAANHKEFYLDLHRTSEELMRGLSINKQIAHMGYAQRSEIVEYKQHTHGHRNEWRRDVDWFRDRFLANAQHDTHPVGSEYWNPEQVNPLDYMPGFMADHPYFNLEVIQ